MVPRFTGAASGDRILHGHDATFQKRECLKLYGSHCSPSCGEALPPLVSRSPRELGALFALEHRFRLIRPEMFVCKVMFFDLCVFSRRNFGSLHFSTKQVQKTLESCAVDHHLNESQKQTPKKGSTNTSGSFVSAPDQLKNGSAYPNTTVQERSWSVNETLECEENC